MTRILMIAAICLMLAAPARAGPVQVDLEGLRAGGTLYVQLQTRDQFLGPRQAYGRVIEAPEAGALSLRFDNVAPGDYAVSIWHDDNDNHQFDFDSATQAPADGWAMTNAGQIEGMPQFDQVKLTIPAAGLRIPLDLRYGR